MPRFVRSLLVGGVLCGGACVAAAVPAVAASGHATFRPAVVPPLTPGCAQPTAFGPVTCTFSTGASSFVVPDGVTSVALTLTGGNGASFARVSPGRGGLVTVVVVRRDAGRRPGHHRRRERLWFLGRVQRWRGGGSGGDASAGGGGATDVSVGGTRVVVAGGGGGSGGPTNLGLLAGGDAGQDASRGPTPATRSSAGVARPHRRPAPAARMARFPASTGLPGRARPAAPAAPPTPASRTGVAVVEAADCSAAAAAPRRRAAAEGRATSHPASPVRSAPAAAGHGRRSPTSRAARSSPS